jgi:hypothetical protein
MAKKEAVEAKTTKAAPKQAAKAVATKESKAVVAKEDLDALSELAGRAEVLDNANRKSNGMDVTFVSLCQTSAKAVDEDDKDMYIEGLAVKDFYVQAKKLKLGKKLRVVPLAFLSVYNEFSESGQQAKFLGIWHAEDAERYDLCADHYYNRELPNGHELRPVVWVLAYLPDFPELEKVVFTFKSTANKIAKEWQKDIDRNAGSACQTLYEIVGVPVSNDKGKWFEIKPTHINNTFERSKDGKLSLIEDFAADVIKKSVEYNAAYAAGSLVKRRSAQKAIGTRDASENDDDDGDDENQEF